MGNKKDTDKGKRRDKGEKGSKVMKEADGSPATVDTPEPEGREST